MDEQNQTLPMDDLLQGLDVRPFLKRDPSLGTIMQSLFNQTEDEGGIVQTQFEVSMLDPTLGTPYPYPAQAAYGSPGPASPASTITSAASAASPHPQSMPVTPGQSVPAPYPANVNSAGDYGFTLEFSEEMRREPVNKSSNTYSPTLQKLFANQDSPCPFTFRTTSPVPFGMELRATPVFTLPHDMSKVVRRCPAHMQEFQVGGAEAREHLILVDPPCHCSYRTDDGRLSVVTPYVPTSMDPEHPSMTVVYRFACHSSCKGGMNRRPISIIFTLENQGLVYGRATLKVRLCACPGRDRIKEQGGNREAPSADEEAPTPEPPKKKRRGRSSTSASSSTSANNVAEAAAVVQSAPATTTSQKLMQSVLLEEEEDDDQIYTIAVKGMNSYRLVKQFADAVELLNEVKHLGGNMSDIRQSLLTTRAAEVAAKTATEPVSQQAPEEEVSASQPLPSSQPFDLSQSQSQPLSSSQQSSGSASGRHVRFTLKRTITPRSISTT
ncbi:cellular tumor antigen p53-like [Sycon ciliatum]|uniref:cellular tumor antigen p53-like n=1 Tax=Sycon ciliatum TaxID=27933 RepID=UPI0020AC1039